MYFSQENIFFLSFLKLIMPQITVERKCIGGKNYINNFKFSELPGQFYNFQAIQ